MLDSLPAPEAPGPFRRALRAMIRVGFGLLLLACVTPAHPAAAQTDDLPLPRYAAFKSNEVNLRVGPGETYPKLWVYQRSNMPVEIFDQEDTWRRIRDYQGVVGWVNGNLLTGRRTAIVIETRRTLRATAVENARPVALLDPGVIGRLEECSGDWCRLEVKGYEGWLKRTEIWGVNPTENFKE
jgi:SH3-like domain-containing protein